MEKSLGLSVDSDCAGKTYKYGNGMDTIKAHRFNYGPLFEKRYTGY